MNEYRDNFQSVTASLASQIQSLEIKIDKLSSSLHEQPKQLKVKNPIKITIAQKLLIILAILVVVQILFFLGYHYTSYKAMFGISMIMNSLFIICDSLGFVSAWIDCR